MWKRKTFSKLFFVSKKGEKSLSCPGNRLKSHQIHRTSIAIVSLLSNVAVKANFSLFNSQFRPENPRRKSFHVHFKDFPYNIWWMLNVTWRFFIFPSLPGVTHFQHNTSNVLILIRKRGSDVMRKTVEWKSRRIHGPSFHIFQLFQASRHLRVKTVHLKYPHWLFRILNNF